MVGARLRLTRRAEAFAMMCLTLLLRLLKKLRVWILFIGILVLRVWIRHRVLIGPRYLSCKLEEFLALTMSMPEG